MKLLPLVLAVSATSVAQVMFRCYFLRRRLAYVIGAVALFCTVPAMNYLALQHWPMSTVYMATGVTYVLVLVLARAILAEAIDQRKIASVALIVAGLVVFNV